MECGARLYNLYIDVEKKSLATFVGLTVVRRGTKDAGSSGNPYLDTSKEIA
jgi:hypothetical protein